MAFQDVVLANGCGGYIGFSLRRLYTYLYHEKTRTVTKYKRESFLNIRTFPVIVSKYVDIDSIMYFNLR